MTKSDFAMKLYVELKQTNDIQKIVDSIQSVKCNEQLLSIDEQLDIVNLIRLIHVKESGGVFESVDSFLGLVNHVEAQILAQKNSESGEENDNRDK